VNVTIPVSVKNIASYAFKWCYDLKYINYGGTVEQWNAVDKGAYWIYSVNGYAIVCTDGVIDEHGGVTYN
jgi:hypothetical protein